MIKKIQKIVPLNFDFMTYQNLFCIACVYSGFVEEKVSSSSFSIKTNKSIKYVSLYQKSINQKKIKNQDQNAVMS